MMKKLQWTVMYYTIVIPNLCCHVILITMHSATWYYHYESWYVNLDVVCSHNGYYPRTLLHTAYPIVPRCW